MPRNILAGTEALSVLLGAARAMAVTDTIPDGFGWLHDVDPTVEQDIRYSHHGNTDIPPIAQAKTV